MSLRALLQGRALLIVVAAEIEARAVLAANDDDDFPRPLAPWTLHPLTGGFVDLLVTGVGKAPAAGAVARLLNPERHAAVLSTGIAGTYGQAPLGAAVAATHCILADEGVATPDGFQDLAALGFPPTPHGLSLPVSAPVLETVRPYCTHEGGINTVSTCSGTNALAAALHTRTGAIAEAMEGAAVALVAHRLNVPFGELRVISNTTGNRPAQVWNIKDALATLSRVIGALLADV